MKKLTLDNGSTIDFGESETDPLTAVSNITHISTYSTVNGKCGWCGADAANLSMNHFEAHEAKDKR